MGMIGIDVPIPVPVACHSFGGCKRSAFGDTNQDGTEGLKFWTKVKTVSERWPEAAATGQMHSIFYCLRKAVHQFSLGDRLN